MEKQERQKPLKVFRQGMIAASVWARTGKRGAYGEMTLSRTYRDGEAFRYASTYRVRDAEALKTVIDEAVKWMQGDEAGFSKYAEESGTDGHEAQSESTGGEDDGASEHASEAA